jgi:hypothetical protein
MRRILGWILILLAAAAAQGKTRMMINGGVDITGNFTDVNYYYHDVPVLNVSVAAEVQQKVIPLEVLAGIEGRYERHRVMEDEYSGINEKRWTRLTATFAAARVYGKLGALEPGVGFSWHQFWKYGLKPNGWQEKYIGMKSQLRAQGFVRLFFYPSERMGPLLEFNVQEALHDRESSDLPASAVFMKLGWTFRV